MLSQQDYASLHLQLSRLLGHRNFLLHVSHHKVRRLTPVGGEEYVENYLHLLYESIPELCESSKGIVYSFAIPFLHVVINQIFMDFRYLGRDDLFDLLQVV